MKPIKKFSLSTDLEIKKPYIQEEFFPTELDLSKLILFAAGDDNSNFPSKLYGYYGDVVDYLTPILKPLGYSFAQIGLNEPAIPGLISFLGLSPNQTAYLIKRVALIIGNDNSNIQIASSLDKKLIALYGPTPHTDHGPSFGSSKDQVLISPTKIGWKPTYSPQEFPKAVNNIKPELVAEKALKLLGISTQIPWETILIGVLYPSPVLELVPNQVLPANVFPNQPISVRLDYHYDQNILAQNLQIRKCNIITDKEIDINLIKQLKGNIVAINYQIDLTTNLEYCKALKNSGAKVVFFSEEHGDALNQLRLKFLDISLIEEVVKDKKPLDFDAAKCKDCYYKSNKFILSEGKTYLSKYDWFKNLPIQGFGQNISKVVDHPYYWESWQFNYFFKLKENILK
jgi:hypothetical protein